MDDAGAATDYMKKAAGLRLVSESFIGGRFVSAADEERFAVISSIDGRQLTTAPACKAVDVDAAVLAARSAFEKGQWANAAPAERKAVLLRLADIMEANSEELALLECLDMGKPIASAVSVDIPASIACIRWCAEQADKLYGMVAPTAPGTVATITREPVGVVAAVIPWNFPLMMAAWKVGPALVTGNSLILKPAEQSPLSAMRLAEMAAEAGLPDGVFNVVTGFGETAGRAIGLHPDIDAVSFTGSTAVGKLFLQYSGQSNMKRVSLECGGKSPAIIMPDADLEFAVETAAWAVFFNQGECCDALSRLLVHRSVLQEVSERLAALASEVKVGHPLDESTQVGAILDEAQFRRIAGYLSAGQAEGARLAFGGERILEDLGGYYVTPALFEGATNQMKIAREEIFGPVITMIDFETEAQALELANDSEYGLVASLFTNDLNAAHRMSKELRAGAVWVNCFDAGDMTVPHGGYRQSGIGRDRSPLCFDKYCEAKTTWINLR
ncbi:MAG TPA: aldehyde dehydrogenase [Caulobacteraceae bacterium]|nr:aldehyde dehydrogenase [Caulobacteraceae bacterium]